MATEGGDEVTARDIAMHIAAFSPSVLPVTRSTPRRLRTSVASLWPRPRRRASPKAALARIIEGRLNGFFKENVLLEQAFAKDAKKTVATVLEESGATAKAFARFRVGS